MKELNAYRAELLSALETVVEEMAGKMDAMPASKLHQPLHGDSRSPHFLIFHLRELEAKVFIPNETRILVEDTPSLPAFDDQAWMGLHYAKQEPVRSIMDELASLRHQELTWLHKLSPANWSRLARHPWWGVHTLQWWVELQLEYSTQLLRQLSS